MDLYPLLMTPYFRHGEETPWGGHALKERYGKDAPDDTTGESLEISALPGRESRIANGPLAGKTLSEVIALWGNELTGSANGEFPLLLKLLDAQEYLSVQVHPNDAYATEHEGKLGKSEAWLILDAEPGAKIVYGVDTQGRALRDIVEKGELEGCLHWEAVHSGDVFYIPSGTIHALGPGIQCYEIQQSSDATYRFWDWGRLGKDGKPRTLHIAKALDVSCPDYRLSVAHGTKESHNSTVWTLYVDDPHFRLHTVEINGSCSLDQGDMQFITPLEACVIKWKQHTLPVNPYQSILIPANLEDVSIGNKGKVIIATSPR